MTKNCHQGHTISPKTHLIAVALLVGLIPTTALAATTTESSVTTTQPANTSPSAKSVTTTTTSVTTSGTVDKAASSQASKANIPLNQPNMKTDDVLKWSEEAVKAAYSYDFKNYKNQIQNTQKYFTDSGWKAFNDALNKSNNLKIVEDKKLVASAVTSKPSLVEEGVKKGVYTWKIQMPVIASYENESKLIKQSLIVTLLITRTNTPNGNGIGISHFLAQIVPQNQQPLTAPQPETPAPSKQPSVDTPKVSDTNSTSGGAPAVPASNPESLPTTPKPVNDSNLTTRE